MRVLVAGVGNLFLGDDGFGAEVARQLARRSLPDGVRVVDYGIRGMHLAYDLLDGWDQLILVDAVPAAGDPGSVHVRRIEPDTLPAGDADPHGMAPHAVLAAVRALGGELPQTLLVACEVADTAERIGLSPAVAAAVGPAVDAVLALLVSTATPAPTGRR